MALKDLKSDLSKWRKPKVDPLVSKKIPDVHKQTDLTPLSNRPISDIAKPKDTPTKKGTEVKPFDNTSNNLGGTDVSPFNNSQNELGGTDPSPFNNTQNNLGGTDPSPFDNTSNNLGGNDIKEFDNSENNLGGTETSAFNNSENNLGGTDVKQFDNSENTLGGTEVSPFDNNQNSLGGTEVSPFDNSENTLGGTEVSPFDNSQNNLGGTDVANFNNNSNELGGTDQVEFNNNLGELGGTDPTIFDGSPNDLGGEEPQTVNYFSDIHATGFTQNVKETQFTGIMGNSVFDGNSSLYSNIDDNSFSDKKSYENLFIDAGGLESGETGFGLGKAHALRRSPSYLDRLYDRYNLKDDSPNFQLGIFRHPLILRGIQRKGVEKKDPQYWGYVGSGFDDGFIRGGIVTSTTRALVDVARITTWLASAEGILWSARQIGLQRTNRWGKTWTPAKMLANVGAQHLGLKFERPGGPIPLTGAAEFSYESAMKANLLLENVGVSTPLNNLVSPLLNAAQSLGIFTPGVNTDLRAMYRKVISRPDTRILRTDLGGFDSLYGEGITETTREYNTFRNFKSNTLDGALTDPLKTYEVLPIDKLEIPLDGDKRYNDFRLDLSPTNPNNLIAKLSNFSFKNLETNTSRGVLLGNPGKVDKRLDKVYSNTNTASPFSRDLYDSLNATDVTNATAPEHNDIVKFWVKAEEGQRVQFRGTIAALTETFTPAWDSFKYNGRADQAYSYSTFERMVTFDFKVYATSRVEMKPIWNKLSYLSTMTMPQYGGAPGYQGTLVKFRLGDLYNDKLAFIESLTYTIPDELNWDMDNDDFDRLGVLPMGVDVNISFKILDDKRPQLGQKVYDTNFITQL